MDINAFLEKNNKPDDRKLSEILGPSYEHLQAIKTSLMDIYGDINEEWKYYGKKYGWSMKLFHKRKNLFFMSVRVNTVRIGFIFGDRAVSAVEQADLPENLKEDLKKARKYAEGTGLQIEIKDRSDVDNVLKLVEIKIRN